MKKEVIASREKLEIPTYGIGEPEKNPVFFEKRVYQGSSGKVYPVPFVDKVYQDEAPKEVSYDSVRLENEFVKLVMLPEIGGRIFTGQDKANEDYDFFYRQDVIKPALVGLAGPWISGGVEFNWPQHHRPGTYMPADCYIEEEEDGARTVWLSEHDPLNRLKGMHGIRLRPNSSLIELRARLFNRTPLTHTFLWWANVAARVHDNYQSFFPQDVHYVADHAVRAMSSFPCAENDYYGINYKSRAGENDLSWYKNIPVPTSYMVCDTKYGFFGGYDFDKEGGFVHVANRHVSPGKKQWTWGNDEFGWAWDRELTDENGPYVELMAGVYTDNQPDFTYLLPGETKTFSQYWWPYQKIGPVQEANLKAAIRLVVNEDRSLDLGLVTSELLEGLTIVLKDNENVVLEETLSLGPDSSWQNKDLRFDGENRSSLCLSVFEANGDLLISFRPVEVASLIRDRALATEPPLAEEIESHDELYLVGEHLEQYRHPTRNPEDYWNKVLEKDPSDSRCNLALGRRYLTRGEFDLALDYLNKAIGRYTSRHPNPVTGEAHYYYGLANKFKENYEEAYTALYKATWNYEWKAAAFYELATLDCLKEDWKTAKDHLQESLRTNAENNKAIVLLSIVERKLGNSNKSLELLRDLLDRDPLDHWAQFELAVSNDDYSDFLSKSRNDAQTLLDVSFEYSDAGLFEDALFVLDLHHKNAVDPVEVPNPLEKSAMTHFFSSWLYYKSGRMEESISTLREATNLSTDYFFPSRLQEQVVLEWVDEQDIDCANACYALGNYYYDKRVYDKAISMWERCLSLDSSIATASRNLGIAYWNVENDPGKARKAYEDAIASNPLDSRYIFEYDQLRKKVGDDPFSRLAYMESNKQLVLDRDDSTVEFATLLNDCDRSKEALELLSNRSFHPWEGGEGKVLKQYTRAHLKLGEECLDNNSAEIALEHFDNAMKTPDNLGEKYHPLQAKADVLYWQGLAHKKMANEDEAKLLFEASSSESGDFQSMAVTEHSELSYYRGLSLIEMGRFDDAVLLFDSLKSYAVELSQSEAKIDYFATSLPNLLVFDEDIQDEQFKQSKELLDLANKGIDQIRELSLV